MRVPMLLLLFSCGTEDPPAAASAPGGGKMEAPMGPPPGAPGGPTDQASIQHHQTSAGQTAGGIPAGETAEDLSSSWRDSLAIPVPGLKSPADCPDEDGDGFGSAQHCEGLDPSQADCDDDDHTVTPATERWVAPGPFLMGSESSHAGFDEKPVHPVQLSGYCMDRTTVSAAEFSAWLNSRSPSGPDIRSIEHDGSVSAGRREHPVEGVTWTEARDYCRDQGKELPTEAQWEKAARGGCEGGTDAAACDSGDLNSYPWGSDTPSCDRANHNLSTSLPPQLCTSDTTPLSGTGSNTGPYGHIDLAGNVWEYVADIYHPTVYGSGELRTDPAGPEEGSSHVLRGGSWNTFSTNMRTANRFSDMVMGSAVGIRCARPTTEAIPDPVEPLEMVTLSGTVSRQGGIPIHGRALYITVFDSADANRQTGQLTPGRSPVADLRLEPEGGSTQTFSIEVPTGRNYLLQSSLDDGSGNDKDDYLSASGSGGFGSCEANPILATQDHSGLVITLEVPGQAGQPQPPPGGQQNLSPGGG
jgi:formylglycine-generating enzyme required for sulfatase activity